MEPYQRTKQCLSKDSENLENDPHSCVRDYKERQEEYHQEEYHQEECHGEYEETEEEEEEEEVIMDEEEMLQMLDKMEPPLSVCQRLLKNAENNDNIGGGDDDDDGDGGGWRILSAKQRESLCERGFVIINGLAPGDLAAQAYEEALARVSAGSLTPAHGGNRFEKGGREEEEEQVTGYVGSVRDDITAFVSVEGERRADGVEDGGIGPIGRTLGVLAELGKDLRRMIRLRGRVEHQLAVYPAGVNARYERHRDAYPDDGLDNDDLGGEPEQRADSALNEVSEAGNSSISFRRVTAICYLRGSNAPWTRADGGALRLYPPATTAAVGDCVTIAWNGGGIDRSGDLAEKGYASATARTAASDRTAPFSGSGMGGTLNLSMQGGGVEKKSDLELVTTEAHDCDEGLEGSECRDSGNSEVFIDVAPIAGRAVVFLSGAVEHEVLPVTGVLPRTALTTWFH